MVARRSEPYPPVAENAFLSKGHPPIAHVESDTRYVEAGPLLLGVEPRRLTTELIAANRRLHGNSPPDREFDDGGVTIHVFESASKEELLRFDCFQRGPHYHYILPGGKDHLFVRFDEVAHGPMIDWVFRTLRSRLTTLLSQAGASTLGPEIDMQSFDKALDKCEELARSAGKAA